MVSRSRKDSNQNEIVRVLEQAGCAVTDMSDCGVEGFTDILVTRAYVHYLIEIKTAVGKLRRSQIEFHRKHRPCHVARTPEGALKIVGLISK